MFTVKFNLPLISRDLSLNYNISIQIENMCIVIIYSLETYSHVIIFLLVKTM